jgi:hypothetical protein
MGAVPRELIVCCGEQDGVTVQLLGHFVFRSFGASRVWGWDDGTMGQWDDGTMGRWDNGTMGRWNRKGSDKMK